MLWAMNSRRQRLQGRSHLDVTRTAVVLVGLGGLGLAAASLFPNFDIGDTWFRSVVLTLLGALLLEISGERRELVETIGRLRSRDRVVGPFETRERTYVEAARLIRDTQPDSDADTVILLSSLHGHTRPRLHAPDLEVEDKSPELVAFRDAVQERLRSNWQMRQVVSFVNVERLEAFVARLIDVPSEARLEIRALVSHDELPALSSLVVARKSAMLATDDDRIYGVGAGIQLLDNRFARWVERHFDEIWNRAPYTIWRPAVGISEADVLALRNALSPAPEEPLLEILRGGPTVYEAAVQALNGALAGSQEVEISLANLHGLSTPRRPFRADLEQQWIQRFEDALDECLLRNPERFRMRAIYNVDSEERLNAVIRSLERWRNADRLEVRAVTLADAVSTLSPLLIGDEFLLGAEDDRLYRSGRAIRLRGKDVTAWGREYFNLVWNDDRAFRIRTVKGVDQTALAELRDQLGQRFSP